MAKLYLMAILATVSPKGAGQTMMASWYDQPGITASGERYNPHKMTAAHKTLPFGTVVHLKKGERTVKVTITDRGPFVKGRHLDLSKAAARHLKIDGVGAVEVLSVKKTLTGKGFHVKTRHQ